MHSEATGPRHNLAWGEMPRTLEPGLPGHQPDTVRRLQGPVEIEREGQKLTFYPVFSPQNDVAYLIVVFGEHEILNYQKELEKATVQAEPVAPKRGPLSRFFRMFLGDKKKKNK